jgi:hypothetical protein
MTTERKHKRRRRRREKQRTHQMTKSQRNAKTGSFEMSKEQSLVPKDIGNGSMQPSKT